MKKENCSRKYILLKEFSHDWDELNIAFKSLILIGVILFLSVIGIAFFSNGGTGITNSIEVVFRTTLASVFGFLLSSNIKLNTKKKNQKLQKIQAELKKIQLELEEVESDTLTKDDCELEEYYDDKQINLVQISIALGICVVCIAVVSILLFTNNLENVPAVSQIRDLMCSSIGFLIGESGKK